MLEAVFDVELKHLGPAYTSSKPFESFLKAEPADLASLLELQNYGLKCWVTNYINHSAFKPMIV